MIDWEHVPMGQLGTAVDIVRALAALRAPLDGEYGDCHLCDDNQELIAARGGIMNDFPHDKPEGHDPKCPWRMAVEWVAAQQQDEECPVCHDTYIDLPSHTQSVHQRSVTLPCGCITGGVGGHLIHWCGQQSAHPMSFAESVIRRRGGKFAIVLVDLDVPL